MNTVHANPPVANPSFTESGSSESGSAESESSEQLVGTGTEWVVDASGCSATLLRDLGLIQRICQQVIADIGVNVVGDPQCHRFDGPGGVTTLYLLSESHLACHTYPEYGLATFNLYCCRERAAWDWQDKLAEALRAKNVEVRQLSRGASVSRDASVCRDASGGSSAVHEGGSSAVHEGRQDFSDRGQGL